MVLVEYGADIHQPDNDGDTPLSLAESTDLKQTIMCKWSTSITPLTHHTLTQRCFSSAKKNENCRLQTMSQTHPLTSNKGALQCRGGEKLGPGGEKLGPG